MAPPDPLIPEFSIKVDGSALSADLYTAVRSVEVREQINTPAACYLKLAPKDGVSSAIFALETFAPGAELEVALGVDGLRSVFSGAVYVLEPTFSDEASLLVTAYDGLHLLRFGTKSRSYNNVTLSDVASDMAHAAGLTVGNVDSTSTTYETLLQDNVSDLEFLAGFLPQLDYELAMSEGKFCFRRSPQGEGSELQLAYPEDVSELWLRLKVLTKGSSVQVRAWDSKNQTAVLGTAAGAADAMGGRESAGSLSQGVASSAILEGDWNILDEAGAGDAARSLREHCLGAFIEGEGEVVGNPALRAGINLTLQGLGARYSGLHYVTSTHHHYDLPGGYKTRFGVRRTGV